jgi:hypothetical protein
MSGWRTSALRIIKTSWGIAIDIHARTEMVDRINGDALSVTPRVFLKLTGVILPTADVNYILRGIKRMAPALEGKEPEKLIVIEVDQVIYTPTDYQPEGVEAAIIGWICEDFGLPSPIENVSFDRAANKYTFSFESNS